MPARHATVLLGITRLKSKYPTQDIEQRVVNTRQVINTEVSACLNGIMLDQRAPCAISCSLCVPALSALISCTWLGM